MLDVVDDAGNTVVVPVVFNAHGRNAEINLATTAYGKENKLWFATQSQNDAVVYANSKKNEALEHKLRVQFPSGFQRLR